VRENPVRFALAYGLLISLVFLGAAGFVLGLVSVTTKANKKSVAAIQQKLNPGAAEAFKDACAGQIAGAAQSGVILVECKLVAPKEVGQKENPQIKGDIALVALSVKDTSGQHYVVFVSLDKSAYATVGQQVTPVELAPKTLADPK